MTGKKIHRTEKTKSEGVRTRAAGLPAKKNKNELQIEIWDEKTPKIKGPGANQDSKKKTSYYALHEGRYYYLVKSTNKWTPVTGQFIRGAIIAFDAIRKTEKKKAVKIKPIKINSIDDFIAFVEIIEMMYPNAKPSNIIGELRQVWFSDLKWDTVVAGNGIQKKGERIDIETKPNRIAEIFAMSNLAPIDETKKPSPRKTMKLNLGNADIGHLIAGVDATLNGYRKEVDVDLPTWFTPIDRRTAVSVRKAYNRSPHKVISDYQTWSGDLGQAYATYLYTRFETAGKFEWIDETKISIKSLKRSKELFATTAELTGDIYGYILVELVKKSANITDDKNIKEMKISDLFKHFIRQERLTKNNKEIYKNTFARVAGVKKGGLKSFIKKRSIVFSKIWIEKYGKTSMQEDWKEYHTKNLKLKEDDQKIDWLVDEFLKIFENK
ncbi:MAG: hypothetical protein GQ574_19640 [Crocinitomix sp.]|nr:hypothetical protein [Crocinitomix sp.]